MKNKILLLFILIIYKPSFGCLDLDLNITEYPEKLSIDIINAISIRDLDLLEKLVKEYSNISIKKCQLNANILAAIINNIDSKALDIFFRYIKYDHQLSKNSALIHAIRRNSFELAEILIKNGADVNTTMNLHGDELYEDYSPIMWAIFMKNLNIINLLEKFGANIHPKTKHLIDFIKTEA